MQLNLATLHVPSMMVTSFLTLVGLICLDTVLGMLQAIIKGTWKWSKIGSFLQTSVLRYLIGAFGLGFLALLQPAMLAVFYAAAATVIANLASDIISKITGFGIQVPEPTTTSTAPGGGTSITGTDTTTK